MAGICFGFLLHLMDTVNAIANSSSFVIFKHMILPLLAKWCGSRKSIPFKTSLKPRGSVIVRFDLDNKLMAIEQH